jgi:hypothetical protein
METPNTNVMPGALGLSEPIASASVVASTSNGSGNSNNSISPGDITGRAVTFQVDIVPSISPGRSINIATPTASSNVRLSQSGSVQAFMIGQLAVFQYYILFGSHIFWRICSVLCPYSREIKQIAPGFIVGPKSEIRPRQIANGQIILLLCYKKCPCQLTTTRLRSSRYSGSSEQSAKSA